jgi:hypothetical protein
VERKSKIPACGGQANDKIQINRGKSKSLKIGRLLFLGVRSRNPYNHINQINRLLEREAWFHEGFTFQQQR